MQKSEYKFAPLRSPKAEAYPRALTACTKAIAPRLSPKVEALGKALGKPPAAEGRRKLLCGGSGKGTRQALRLLTACAKAIAVAQATMR